MERKSKKDIIIMTEKFTPFFLKECRENTEVAEYRRQLMKFELTVEHIEPPKSLPGEKTILDSLPNEEGRIALSEVLSDICFNSLMLMDSLKSALDIAFDNLEPRVTVFIVSPHFDPGLKEYEKVGTSFK